MKGWIVTSTTHGTYPLPSITMTFRNG